MSARTFPDSRWKVLGGGMEVSGTASAKARRSGRTCEVLALVTRLEQDMCDIDLPFEY